MSDIDRLRWLTLGWDVGEIRHQYGVASAFDYLVGEKLLTFAEAAE